MIIYKFTPWEFLIFVNWWSFTGVWVTASLQVSRNLPSILADLNNAVVLTVSTRPVISDSSNPCINPLVIVASTSFTIGIIVTFMFHWIFYSLSRSRYLSLFSLSFNFTLWSAGTQFCKSSFFVDYYKVWSSVRVSVIRLYLKSSENFVCLSSRTDSWLCI